jgi:hypothetical protein
MTGEPTWEDTKTAKMRYYTQLIYTDLEKTLHQPQYIEDSIF